MKAKQWIVISGFSWLVIGVYLMLKGLSCMTLAMMEQQTPVVLMWLKIGVGSIHQGALALICLSLLIGFIKGRLVLSKTVSRIAARIYAQAEPIRIANAYDRKYYVILASMVGLGLLFRVVSIPYDIRGAIDVTIGSALINGAMLYFRQLVKSRLQS